jgi:integrase/recombinase XerC
MNNINIRKITLLEAVNAYLERIKLARSENTLRTYSNAMQAFISTIEKNKHSMAESPHWLPEEAVAWFANDLKVYSPATERLYLTATIGFYEFLASERICEPNLPRIRLIMRQRMRRTGQRLPQFPRSEIDTIIEYINNPAMIYAENNNATIRNMRDRAFLITLADTGLRVHEACALRRGDIDWNEGRAIIIGKGNQQAIVRFSERSLSSIREYLGRRAELDGSSGRPLGSLPIFARHDRGAGKKVKPMTTTTGRNIVTQRVKESLGKEAIGTITPHSFRHYFVTTVLRGSGGNLKLAQELARHKNISVTQRYAHLSNDELDRGYYEIFDKLQNK